MKNFQDLFRHELQDIYSAETQFEKALAEYEMAASSPELKEAFRTHRQETRKQVEILERLAKEQNIKLTGHTCEAMKTFLKEAQNVMKADYSPVVRDAALISSAQRIKHYEIALYGTLKAFARAMKLTQVANAFKEILKEELNTDNQLTEIAIGRVSGRSLNAEAVRKAA